MNIALTDLITNLPKSKNISHFTANASNAKLKSFDQKLQDIFSNIEKERLGFKNSPLPEKEVIKNNNNNNNNNDSNKFLIKTDEKSNNELLVTLNMNDSKDLIISNTKKAKSIHLDVDQLLLLIETSIKNTKDIDQKELLTQAQKILSSPKTEFTEDDLEVLQKALSIITKESKDSKGSNSEIPLEGLIKHSKSTKETPPTLSQNSLDSKGSQETNQILQSDIRKLLQLTEESLESVKNKDEINTLEQAQKILSSPKTKFTRSELETLQKAFSIIIKENKVIQSSNSEESKANKSQIPSEGLIKPSKFTEKDPTIMLQRKLPSNGSQRTNQIVNSDIRELLSTIQESSKNTENKNEFNKSANGIDGKELLNQAQETGAPTKIQFTEEDKRELLIQAQKILSSPKTEFTKAELETLQKALSIIIKEIKDSQPINNELPSEGLIKHSKFTEKDPTILSQNSLDSKASQEADQIVNPDIQKLLQLIEESSKNTENKDEINLEEAQKILISSKPELTKEDKRELLIQAQKILSSPKTEFTKAELETLQKALSIIIKESKVTQPSNNEDSQAINSEIPLEDLIKHSNSIEETSPTLSQKNLHLKDSQEANQIVNSDIQKLLSTIQESSKSIESKNEINTLEQAQKILSSPKTEFTKAELETLQKALNIIIKESKVTQPSNNEDSQAINSEIPLEGLIKTSKFAEKDPTILSQKSFDSKGSQEVNQVNKVTQSDIQKLLSTIQESSKNTENKDEINTLEQAQKILSSSKTELTKEDKEVLLIQAQKILSSSKTTFTPEELNIIKTALGITTNNNPKTRNSSLNTIGETTFIANSLIKGNTDKTKNNKNENNNSIKSMQFDLKEDRLNTKNNLGKNVYFDPYETRKSNINKDKNSDLQKDNTVKLTPPSNLEDTSKNLNIEQLKTTQSTNEIDLKSLQINKNNIQDGIPTTNLKDLNAQIKEVIISKTTQTFLNESFSVKISPPDLGKVDIQILKNGQAVTVNISTETENAKNIISKTLQSLVGNLRDEGYQPISIKVNVTQEENYLADQNQQHQQEQEQKKYHEEDHNGDQSEEGTYYTFDEYLRSDLNA